jgi:hypothetical protein
MVNLIIGGSQGYLGVLMTSIAATGTASYQSPLQKLQAELQSEVSSGAISSTDQGALSSALTDIDSSLQSQPASDLSGAQSSPDDLKSKIDTLIAGEVSSGKLTSDQATELQKVFSNTFASGDPGGPDAAAAGGGAPPAGGAGGAHKAGGHHHGGHGGAKGAGGASSSADSTDSSSTTSASDLLQQFLQSLQDSQSSASSAGYDANGDGSSTTSASSALLIDYQS